MELLAMWNSAEYNKSYVGSEGKQLCLPGWAWAEKKLCGGFRIWS